MKQKKTSSQLLDTAERRAFVLRMRKAGATYEEIAEATAAKFGFDQLPKGWDSRYAWKDVKRELDKLREDIAEDTEAVRQLELERLNDMLKALWSRAANKNSDYKAVDRVLKIMKRRARLIGLDAREKKDITTGGEPIEVVAIGGLDPEKDI